MKKRTRILGLLMILLLGLGGCGFHLRGQVPGTVSDKTVMVTGMTQGGVYGNYVAHLNSIGGRITQKSSDAVAIINIASIKHIRRPITLSSIGRANMFDLTFRVIYDIKSPKGETLVPEREINIRREYFNTQTEPLSQSLEEGLIRAEMEKEAALVLLRQSIKVIQDRQSPAPSP